MKTYFRLLSFAKPIEKFAIPYFIYTVLAVIFSTINFPLLIPLMNTLFLNTQSTEILQPGAWYNLIHNFNYYSQQAYIHYGTYGALKFVCGALVASVLLSNIFKYLSQRVMELMRIHTTLNLRRAVFNNVIDLHLGYFSNERKGHIIAKVSGDVGAVQSLLTNSLQVFFKEPLQLIAYLVALFVISVKLTLFSMTVIPLSAFIIAKIVKRLKEQARQSLESGGTMLSYLDESLTGIKIIKAFNAEEFIKQKYHSENVIPYIGVFGYTDGFHFGIIWRTISPFGTVGVKWSAVYRLYCYFFASDASCKSYL